jgi:hypothetical protein
MRGCGSAFNLKVGFGSASKRIEGSGSAFTRCGSATMALNTVNDKYIFVIAKANLLSAQKTLYKFSKADFKQTTKHILVH